MAGCYPRLADPGMVGAFAVVFGIFISLGEFGPGNNIGRTLPLLPPFPPTPDTTLYQGSEATCLASDPIPPPTETFPPSRTS